MRQINLLTYRLGNAFVDGLNATGTLARFLDLVQGDTIDLRFVHVDKDASSSPENLYRITPWPSGLSVRMSAMLIDAAPDSGSFKLRLTYDDNSTDETTAIAWNSTAATFKTAVVNAIKAISGFPADGVELTDPADTPGNFVYLTFSDASGVVSLEVFENGLAPVTLGKCIEMREAPLRQILLKLTLAPFKLASFATGTTPVQPIVAESTEGGAGANEIQTITFDPGTGGGLRLIWNGAKTELLAIPGATVAQVQDALNAIVPDGASNPSFRVAILRENVLAVEFIGPLAGAAQAALGAEIIASPSTTELAGTIPLTGPMFERLLNGAARAECTIETVITSTEGEGTILLPCWIYNDGTDADVEADLEAAGAVVERDRTVTVTVGEAVAVATVSAGQAFEMAELAVSDSYEFEHDLDSKHVFVRISHRDSDDPEKWSDLKAAYYDWESTSANFTTVTFAAPLVTTPSSSFYFREKFKVFIYSPDSIIQLLKHTHTIAEVDGLQAALDALSAALGMLNGSLRVDVANLIGKLTSNQIDLRSFLTDMFALIKSDTTLASLFSAQLQTTILGDTSFLTALTTGILNALTSTDELNSLFIQKILEAMSSIQATGAVNGITQIPAFELTVPVPTAMDGPKKRVPQVVTEETTTTTGGNTVKRTFTHTEDVEVASTIYLYGALSRAKTSLTDGGTKSAVVLEPGDGTEGTYYTVSGANVSAAAVEGRPAIKFANADIITVMDGHWCKMVSIDGVYYPAELERALFTLPQNAKMFVAGSGWNIQCFAGFVLSSESGTTTGKITLVIETGVYTPSGAAPHLASIAWTERASIDLPLSNAPLTLPYSVQMTRPDGSTYTGKVKLGATETTFTPSTADIAVRSRITKFDLLDVAEPYGAIGIKNTGTASLVTI